MVERKTENTATKRTHTWTIVTDSGAVVNKVKQQNYNDYTDNDNIVAIHN